jgi:hypothetical protein
MDTKKWKRFLNESTLSRLISKYMDIGFIIISADRTCEAESGRDCSEAEERQQEKINKENEERIKEDIRNAGFGFVPTYGGYREERGINKETGKKEYVDTDAPENSFIIPSKEGNDQDLKNLGIQLSRKYNQDSFLLKEPSSVGNNAYFITKEGEVDMTFNDIAIDDLEQEYYTMFRKNSHRFSFVQR